jgi:hypothetical protein
MNHRQGRQSVDSSLGGCYESEGRRLGKPLVAHGNKPANISAGVEVTIPLKVSNVPDDPVRTSIAPGVPGPDGGPARHKGRLLRYKPKGSCGSTCVTVSHCGMRDGTSWETRRWTLSTTAWAWKTPPSAVKGGPLNFLHEWRDGGRREPG